MLTIVVGPRKENIETADKKNMRVYPLLIEEGNKFRCFQERTDYKTVGDVEILAIRWFLPFRALRLKLSPEIKKSVVEFLRQYHAKRCVDFDCYSFAVLVRGLKQHSKSYLWGLWNFRRPRLFPQVGDIVFLLSENRQRFHHAAVYIGWGLYLSVYGSGGDLEIATLKDMKKDYGAEDIVRAILCT